MREITIAFLFIGMFSSVTFAQQPKKIRPRIVHVPATKKIRPRIVHVPTTKKIHSRIIKIPISKSKRESYKKVPKSMNDGLGNNYSIRRPVLAGDAANKKTSTDLPPPPPLIRPTENMENASSLPLDEEDEIIKIDTNFVTLPVTVMDREGRFVSGITPREFKIYENGIEQNIEEFAPVEKPFTVILLLDVSPSTQYKINEIHRAAISFVNQLRSQDKVMVAAFDSGYRILSPPTNDRYQMREAIKRARFGNGTSLYDAVKTTTNRVLGGIPGRKAVVLFTDGVDTSSTNSDYPTTLRQVEEADALIYPVRYDTYSGYAKNTSVQLPSTGNEILDILGKIILGSGINLDDDIQIQIQSQIGTSAEDYRIGKTYLTELARHSGGRIFEADTIYNLDSAFRSIAEELRRQYSLGYYPTATGEKGERRKIQVRVMRPNLVIRTKRSYIVGRSSN